MKLLERYGPPLLSYEGSCRGTFRRETFNLDYSGYFQATQYSSGRIAIGVMSTDPFEPHRVAEQPKSVPELTFAGSSTDGWELAITDTPMFNRFSWEFLAMFATPPTEYLIGAKRIEATNSRFFGFGYSTVQFLISNFLWHDAEGRDPESIELSVNCFRIIITPVKDYQDVAYQLSSVRGVQPTAHVYVNHVDEEQRSLRSYADFLDDFVCVLRLVTGNQVSWYYGEALDNAERPIARIHNHSIPTPYSDIVRFRYADKVSRSLIQKLELTELVTAFFDEADRIFDKTTINTFVNQLTNATGNTTFLESAGLVASSLTELIASKYAESRSKSEKIREGVYNDLVLPRLKSAVKDTALHGDLQEHIGNYLKGGFRHSFRSKLKLLRDELNLPLNSSNIDQIVNTRNDLVHRGEYSSDAEGLNWLIEYNFIVWTDIMILCRLMGYKGKFTKQISPEDIEV